MSTIEKALAKQKLAQHEKLESPSEVENNVQEISSTPVPIATEQISHNKDKIILNGDRLNERGFIYSPDSAHHIQEEFRHIKRKLLNNAFG